LSIKAVQAVRLGASIDYKKRTDEDFDEIIHRLSGMREREGRGERGRRRGGGEREEEEGRETRNEERERRRQREGDINSFMLQVSQNNNQIPPLPLSLLSLPLSRPSIPKKWKSCTNRSRPLGNRQMKKTNKRN
jgi:hypothetical protein